AVAVSQPPGCEEKAWVTCTFPLFAYVVVRWNRGLTPPARLVLLAAPQITLLLPPLCHRLMVPAEEDFRHLQPAEVAGPGVLRVLQAALFAVALVGGAGFVAQHPGDEPNHRVDHH